MYQGNLPGCTWTTSLGSGRCHLPSTEAGGSHTGFAGDWGKSHWGQEESRGLRKKKGSPSASSMQLDSWLETLQKSVNIWKLSNNKLIINFNWEPLQIVNSVQQLMNFQHCRQQNSKGRRNWRCWYGREQLPSCAPASHLSPISTARPSRRWAEHYGKGWRQPPPARSVQAKALHAILQLN